MKGRKKRMELGFTTLMRCFFRTYLVGANFNTRGMQNIGLAFAIDPGLEALYSSAKQLRRARKRYLHHYNTHPFWTPLLVGFFLFLERKISKGLLPERSVSNIKGTTMYTLSAIGDSFFGGALLVFWSLTTIHFLLLERYSLAFGWSAVWFISLQGLKMYTLYQGYQNGLLFLQRLKQWDLINWSQRIKVVNAILVVALWAVVFPLASPEYWFPAAAAVCSLAWLGSKIYWAREILLLIYVLACVAILHLFL
ncbi:MAG: PTS system mannose/fructose/sorbose family transporter subunit IID [Desulfovibrionales bacterium]